MRGYVSINLIAIVLIICIPGLSQTRKTSIHVLVLTERTGIHEGFVVAAMEWLNEFSVKQHFEFTVINNTDSISESFLSGYRVFIQLNYPPYMWTDQSKAAFIKYMEEGRGGWIGFH